MFFFSLEAALAAHYLTEFNAYTFQDNLLSCRPQPIHLRLRSSIITEDHQTTPAVPRPRPRRQPRRESRQRPKQRPRQRPQPRRQSSRGSHGRGRFLYRFPASAGPCGTALFEQDLAAPGGARRPLLESEYTTLYSCRKQKPSITLRKGTQTM